MLAVGRSAVVAARAVIGYAGVIVGTGTPGNGVMALFAGPAVGGDVRWRQAGGDGAVVTADTGAPYGRVIDTADAGPAQSRVTGFTAAVGSNMLRILAGGDGSVVAGAAIAGNIAVIENRMPPVHGGMTVIALIVTRHVCGCLTL